MRPSAALRAPLRCLGPVLTPRLSPSAGRGEQLHLQHHRDLAQSKHKENPALDTDPRALATLMSPKH